MGILNVTADSFSDGGRWLDPDAALEHARRLMAAGADIIDVGGESTRPGAARVDAEVEIQRVVPIIAALHAEGIPTSVDTMRAATAAAAVEAGVGLINDVSGGLADPDMFAVMAQSQLPVCLMHWRTSVFESAAGAADHGGDVVADVRATLADLAARAQAAGVDRSNIIVDPGLGFAKTPAENWALLRALPSLSDLPILVGASRKRFVTALRAPVSADAAIPAISADAPAHTPVASADTPAPAAVASPSGTTHPADPATAAISALSAHYGAWAVRVHDVASSRAAVDVAAAWAGAVPGTTSALGATAAPANTASASTAAQRTTKEEPCA
ncbi:dihydropteroate synthase [Corynebacterium lizhenjunii]|uniref:dihydropteroate synthase n=1 Tax=Corynebacterium lizhenjunii TaxID=2709394 RepID=A0A7T0KHI0_9CORY|nr:dihydropteroate synthase [Corynebacterium lizhenjunii]QPK80259.1 dihydropteroate synthase [Corynebacterium lizhenjunii]